MHSERRNSIGRRELGVVAALSLAFTYLFFFEYLPPITRVHLPYDLEGYHYPLMDYAFQALRAGRFPEWDSGIYCGLSLVGNVQAALFYPPSWLLFAASAGRQRLPYQNLEALVFAHVWLAFFLCWVWLRAKGLAQLSSILGAGVFAFSGYMLLQLQHFGLDGGFAWIPLAFWGIDQATESRDWRPLWKVTAASALCFLAGYTPFWFVFCVLVVTYALLGAGSWRAAIGTGLALAFSLLIVMVQLLPTREAQVLKSPELRYGAGIREGEFYLPYLLPNYFDFSLPAAASAKRGQEYLYLGAPALFGLACLARRRNLRTLVPAIALGAVSLVGLTNPGGLVWDVVKHSSLLSQLCRDWYFLGGLTLAAAMLAAYGLDDFLKRSARPTPRWLLVITVGLLVAWSVRLLWIWLPGGWEFASGWKGIYDPLIMLVLFAAGLWVVRAEPDGGRRRWIVAALLLAVAADYKAFGTSKRFNAGEGDVDASYRDAPFQGLDDVVYRELRANTVYRIAVDQTGPFGENLRHWGLSTPQGFDPFFSTQYKQLLGEKVSYHDGFVFDLQPEDHELLRLLAVRYFMTSEHGPLYHRLLKDPAFRLLEPSQSFYKVFELQGAALPYGWETPGALNSLEAVSWQPERRELLASSAAGGRMILKEQIFPGWQARIDGQPAPLERWKEAFQSVHVPPGQHHVEFVFRSPGVRLGALVSLASTALLAALAFRSRRPA